MKKLVRVAAVFIALVAMVLPVYATPTIPWTTFSGEMANALRPGSAGMSGCPPANEVFIAAFNAKDAAGKDVVFIMAFAPETGNVLFLYDPHPDDSNAPPTEVGFGKIDPSVNDKIPALTWVPYEKDNVMMECGLLFPATAKRET